MQRLLRRSRVLLLTMATGGGLFVLQGCDPTVRDTMLTGVGTAATGLAGTFIEAFIQSLQSDTEGDSTTVRALPSEPQPVFV